MQVLDSLILKTFCSISIILFHFFLVKAQTSYIRHLAAITLQHIYKISITVAKGYNSSINHLPIIKSSISYTQVQKLCRNLGAVLRSGSVEQGALLFQVGQVLVVRLGALEFPACVSIESFIAHNKLTV
jgi:hypothetical protein